MRVTFSSGVVTKLSHMWSYFFFYDTATTEIYTLSLHDALPIFLLRADGARGRRRDRGRVVGDAPRRAVLLPDRKSTRLNSSHVEISYAVFCLKKKKLHAANNYIIYKN